MKHLILIFTFLVANAANAQQNFGDPTYRIYLDIGLSKNAGTNDLVILTLAGNKDQENFYLENSELNDNDGGLSIFSLRSNKYIGDLVYIRLEVKKRTGNSKIDDLYIKTIKINHIQNGKSTDTVKINKAIGDGLGNGLQKNGNRVLVSITKSVDWN